MSTATLTRIPVTVARYFDGLGDAGTPEVDQILTPGSGWNRVEPTEMTVPLLCALHRAGATQVTVRTADHTADFNIPLMVRQEIQCSTSTS